MRNSNYTEIIGKASETLSNNFHFPLRKITIQLLQTKKKEMFFLLIG